MLTPGTSIGPYQVTARIGQGGMGEVFKAHDSRLGRDVAIKVSNEAFSDRFAREARSIAALNHTNICHLYDVGPDYLVMEFVDGTTLHGPMDFEAALPIIGQLIDGIEAAHERNIIHRDLKPANIKVTPEGIVKILDFGLAKAMSPDPAAADVTNSPTLAPAPGATVQGAILGTAGYMAPEQARGKPADRRADIWAFGVIVYELLTGRHLFDGETAIDILGQVLNKPLDLSGVPPRARPLLDWCLERDRKERLRDIGDARKLLRESPAVTVSTTPPPSWLTIAGWAVAAIALAVLAVTRFVGASRPVAVEPLANLSVAIPGSAPTAFLALSPDGRTLILKQASALVVRSLDSKVLRPLPATANARNPFFSPDGRTIAFFADGMLKTLPLAGGPAQILCRDTGNGFGGTWSEDGTILFATSVSGLKKVPATGGDCTDVLKPEAGLRAATLPEFLPDGRHFLYVREGAEHRFELFAASLDEPRGHRLLPDASSAQFIPDVPSSTVGYLLFRREGKLVAQPFDANAITLSGDAVVVADAVGTTNSPPQAAAAASRTGTIVYIANGQPERQLIWYDRAGTELRRASNTGIQGSALSLSPDGRVAAFLRSDNQNAFEARLVDLETNQDLRLFAPPLAPSVVWSPDSARVAFWGVVDNTLGIFTKPVTGGNPELLLRGENQRIPSQWSHDGRAVLYTEYDAKTLGDIWLLPVSQAPTPVTLLRTSANETQGQLSPDGKWLAYVSDESGTNGVYVRAFTGSAVSAGSRLVSATATEPRWRADGKELFYLEIPAVPPRRRVMAVAIGADFDHLLGTPQLLFEFLSVPTIAELNRFQYAPSADGQRFLMNAHATDAPPSVDVLLNWPASVRKSR